MTGSVAATAAPPPEQFRMNPGVEIVPDGDRVLLRLPALNRTLPASNFFVGLLRSFEEARAIDDVMRERPFRKDESIAFLERAKREGFLVRVVNGAMLFPRTADPPVRFCAAPAFDPSRPARFVVLGVPWDREVTGRAGARFGPAAIRSASESARFHVDPVSMRPLGFWDFASGTALLEGEWMADAGDIVAWPGEDAERVRRRISDTVGEIATAGAIPFLLGGDHSITRPALEAMHGPLHVIHLDAHSDLGEIAPGTGLHHGNVMALVLDELTHVAGIHQIGLRGLYDRPTYFSHERVRQLGMDRLRAEGVQKFIDGIPHDAACWLSIDIDVVDPAFAPATGTPVPGGLMPHELKDLVRTIGSARRLVGGDLVEVSEPMTSSDGTAGLAAACLLWAFQGMVEFDAENSHRPKRRRDPREDQKRSRDPSARRKPRHVRR